MAVWLLLFAVMLVIPKLAGAEDTNIPGDPAKTVGDSAAALSNPGIDRVRAKPFVYDRESRSWVVEKHGVDWKGLAWQSGFFMGLQHAFRLGTEPGTREGMKGPFFSGYFDSVKSLHGWSDQDPFYVNYVGHPMQGAVTGFIWTHSDRDFRGATFSSSSYYWKSRLRAAAFTWAYSVLFEIGPVSEASIGKIQSVYPQHGMVDHVVTPVIGMGWMIGEDALDQYIVKRLEAKVKNPYLRLFIRGGLNPARSFANAMRFEAPWKRDDRPGVFSPVLSTYLADERAGLIRPPKLAAPEIEGEFGLSTMELTATFKSHFLSVQDRIVPCLGGGGEGAFRVSRHWQFLVDVSGCKVTGFESHQSADALTYLAGIRWSPRPSSRWDPYVQVKAGGMNVTAERVNLELKQALLATQRAERRSAADDYRLYAVNGSSNKFAISVGGGVQYRVQPSLSFKLVDLEYLHTANRSINDQLFSNGFTVGAGVDLRIGTW